MDFKKIALCFCAGAFLVACGEDSPEETQAKLEKEIEKAYEKEKAEEQKTKAQNQKTQKEQTEKYMAKLENDACFRFVYAQIPWQYGNPFAHPNVSIKLGLPPYEAQKEEHPFLVEWNADKEIRQSGYSDELRAELEKKFKDTAQKFVTERNIFDLYMCLKTEKCSPRYPYSDERNAYKKAPFEERLAKMTAYLEKEGELAKYFKLSEEEVQLEVAYMDERFQKGEFSFIKLPAKKGDKVVVSCEAK